MFGVLVREESAIVLAGNNNEIEVSELRVTDTQFINEEPKELQLSLIPGSHAVSRTDIELDSSFITKEQITEAYGKPEDYSMCYSKIWYTWVLETKEGERLEIRILNAERYGDIIEIAYDDESSLQALEQDLNLNLSDD